MGQPGFLDRILDSLEGGGSEFIPAPLTGAPGSLGGPAGTSGRRIDRRMVAGMPPLGGPLPSQFSRGGGGPGGGGGILDRIQQALLGREGQQLQISPFTDIQRTRLQRLLGMGMEGLEGQQDFDFEPIAELARKRFQERGIPSLLERFGNLGGEAEGSGAMARALATGQADLEAQLASLQQQFGFKQREQASGLAAMGLTPEFQTAFQPATGGALGRMAPGIGNALTLLAGRMAGLT